MWSPITRIRFSIRHESYARKTTMLDCDRANARNPHETPFKSKLSNREVNRRSGLASIINNITNKDSKKTVCKCSYSHVRILTIDDVSRSLRMPGAYCREHNDGEHKIALTSLLSLSLSLPEKNSQPPPSEFDDRAGATDHERPCAWPA